MLCCVSSAVYRLEQLAPRPKCVISRLQVPLSPLSLSLSLSLCVSLSVRLSVFSVFFLRRSRDVLEYSIKPGSLKEQSRDGCHDSVVELPP